MLKPLLHLLFFLGSFSGFGLDLSTQILIWETDSFVYYAEDSRDYSELISLMEQSNAIFESIFSREMDAKITVYIFSDQLSFSRHVFHSEEPILGTTGFADPDRLRFFITSFYDDCRPKHRLLQTPVHELVHLYYPSEQVWIREGVACYFSGMVYDFHNSKIPTGLADLHFYTHAIEEKELAYNFSAWMVKYILEEILEKDLESFRELESNGDLFLALGFPGEREFFEAWKNYLMGPRAFIN